MAKVTGALGYLY